MTTKGRQEPVADGEQGPRRPTELADRVQELETALRARDELVAVLSRELRGPLTPMVTALQLLLEDGRLPRELRVYVEMLQRNVMAQARLSDDLGDFLALEQGRLQLATSEVELEPLLERARGALERDVLAQGTALVLRLGAGGTRVLGDGPRLEQGLFEIIRHALRNAPPGGEVSVRTTLSQGQLEIVVEGAEAGAFLEGPRARRHGGLGLGLTIGRGILQLHRGRLDAKDGGAVVVTLPIVASLPTLVTTKSVPSDLAILLVDDHEDTLALMRMMLERRGYKVATAGNCAEAMLAAEQRHPDLLITDIGLPDESGLVLLRRLRDRRQLVAIALSGFGREEDVRQSREAGFVAHLTKPVNVQRLHELITSLFS